MIKENSLGRKVKGKKAIPRKRKAAANALKKSEKGKRLCVVRG